VESLPLLGSGKLDLRGLKARAEEFTWSRDRQAG